MHYNRLVGWTSWSFVFFSTLCIHTSLQVYNPPLLFPKHWNFCVPLYEKNNNNKEIQEFPFFLLFRGTFEHRTSRGSQKISLSLSSRVSLVLLSFFFSPHSSCIHSFISFDVLCVVHLVHLHRTLIPSPQHIHYSDHLFQISAIFKPHTSSFYTRSCSDAAIKSWRSSL